MSSRAPLPEPAAPTAFHIDHRKGIALAAVGVTVLSVDALLIRLAAAPAVDVAFWRGLLVCLALTLVFRVRRRRWTWTALREGGWPTAGLVLAEEPPPWTLAGGTLVITALVIHYQYGSRPQTVAPPS